MQNKEDKVQIEHVREWIKNPCTQYIIRFFSEHKKQFVAAATKGSYVNPQGTQVPMGYCVDVGKFQVMEWFLSFQDDLHGLLEEVNNSREETISEELEELPS